MSYKDEHRLECQGERRTMSDFPAEIADRDVANGR